MTGKLASPSRLLWSIALPAMLTNVATALFGLADMWVIGRLGDPAAQGAVELGAKFMTGLLVSFNFLRNSTVALTAQSAGRGDAAEQAATLVRALAVALGISALLLIVRPVAIDGGLVLLEASGKVATDARTYIGIRYWAGAAWLLNCVLVGWLIGRRRVRAVLAVEVSANLAHIALDLGFVLGLGWGVAGVATATLCSELLKLLFLAGLVSSEPAARQAFRAARERAVWNGVALRQLFSLNRDLFLRTLLLTAAKLIFARSGAQKGPVILAANGILFQLFMLSTLVLDGFESAAQVLCGETRGSGDRAGVGAMVRAALLWGGVTAIVLALAYGAAGGTLAASFSTDPQVVETADTFAAWLVLLPLVGFVSFVLDGVFVGARWTQAMLVTMAVALALYIALLFVTVPLGNHGLWLSFALFFTARGAGQLWLLPRLVKRDFA